MGTSQELGLCLARECKAEKTQPLILWHFLSLQELGLGNGSCKLRVICVVPKQGFS